MEDGGCRAIYHQRCEAGIRAEGWKNRRMKEKKAKIKGGDQKKWGIREEENEEEEGSARLK